MICSYTPASLSEGGYGPTAETHETLAADPVGPHYLAGVGGVHHVLAPDVHGHVLDGRGVSRVGGPVDQVPDTQVGDGHMAPEAVLVGRHPGDGDADRLPGFHHQTGAVERIGPGPAPLVGAAELGHGPLHGGVAGTEDGVDEGDGGDLVPGRRPEGVDVALV